MKALSEILQGLNENQLKAVEQTEGPVMVVAGPGTGKTQILAARIANILQQTQTDPKNVLCLTYTDAGARAMRERLISMIGTTAYEVQIHTFHSLGSEIIRENEELFGGKGLQPISDLEKEQMLRELLDNLPADSALKNAKEYHYQTGPLAQIFGLIKTENIDVEKEVLFVQNYIDDLPNMEEFQYKRNSGNSKKGDPKTGEIKKITDKLNRLIDALNMFPLFLEKMRALRRFDYDDMLLWVKNAFEADDMLLKSYQERFHYYLVDEFQDTNGIQAALLYLLAGKTDNPNVFVVGDDDQSIYSFQGANYKRLLDFTEIYQDSLRTIVLDKNYRSSQNILDASSGLVGLNSERLINEVPGLSKDLLASNPSVMNLPERPVLTEFSNETQEAAAVSKHIEKLIDEGVAPSDIAIIYRQHRQAEEISRFLMSKNIPLFAVRAVNILEEPLILNVLTLLEYVYLENKDAFSGEHLLFNLLHLEFFGLEPLEVAIFSLEVSKKRDPWRKLIAERCKQKPQGALFEGDTFEDRLRIFYKELEFWIKEANNLTVAELVEKVIAKGGFLSYAIGSEEKNWNLQVLKTFFDHVKDEIDRDPYLKLSRFLQDIRTMQDLGIRIEIRRIYGTNKGVNMITAHSSKGLEFDHVFLIGCTSKIWTSKDRKLPFEMNLIMKEKNESSAEDEESRRLFYVAMTRAKKTLNVSWSTEKDNPSQFVTELKNTNACEEIKAEPEDGMTTEFIAAQFVETEEQTEVMENAWLDRYLESFSLSVTHLNQYLRCPVSYYYEKVLRVPAAKNKHVGFGSAVHDTLEAWIKAANNSGGNFWGIDRLIEEFDKQMYYQRACFTEDSYKHMLDYGKQKLSTYYKRRIEHLKQVPKLLTEMRFRTEFEGLPINGAADRIEVYDSSANLIDYKTGKPENGKKKLSPPDPNAKETDSFEKRMGGDYWRQLVFYKLLVDLSADKGIKMQSAEIDFIEEDETEIGHHKVFVSDDDIEIVKSQIKLAEQGIKSKQFRKGCGETDCNWCNFERSVLKGRNYTFEGLIGEEEF